MTMRKSTVGVMPERGGVAPAALASAEARAAASGSLEPLRGAAAPSNSGGGGVPAAMREVGSPRAAKDASGVGVGSHAVRKDENDGFVVKDEPLAVATPVGVMPERCGAKASPSGGGAPLVLKIGGELLEEPSRLEDVVAAIATIAASGVGLVVAHGGGREIDAALKAAGIEKRQVEGLRITDERTLGVVVAVLVGTVNTRLVAALTAAEVAAVGLTGVDGACGLAEAAPPHRTVDGRSVDLGRVGIPSEQADMRLLTTLLRNGFVPVVASIGVGRDGRLLNVNADTFAGHLAARIGARRLVIAGTTPGVLGEDGATVPALDGGAIAQLVAGGTATAGMIAKLRACEHALAGGVEDVVIVDGRNRSALQEAATGAVPLSATRCAGLAPTTAE
jgi:acetylglutamate kinase